MVQNKSFPVRQNQYKKQTKQKKKPTIFPQFYYYLMNSNFPHPRSFHTDWRFYLKWKAVTLYFYKFYRGSKTLLPNFLYYYRPHTLYIWIIGLNMGLFRSLLSWLILEEISVHPVSLKASPYSPLYAPLSECTHNVIVSASIKIWFQFRCHFGLQTLSTPLSSFFSG